MGTTTPFGESTRAEDSARKGDCETKDEVLSLLIVFDARRDSWDGCSRLVMRKGVVHVADEEWAEEGVEGVGVSSAVSARSRRGAMALTLTG